VSDDNRPWIERFDFIDSGKPIVEAFLTGLHEIWMRAIVDGVACDDETDRWDVKASSVISICVADVQGDYRVAFKTECAAVKRLGSDKMIWDLSRKRSLPIQTTCGKASARAAGKRSRSRLKPKK
jgi:hypothetical protein